MEESCDTLPTSLVLAKNEENNCKTIIGHSKIISIPSIPDSGFVTSGKHNLNFWYYKREKKLQLPHAIVLLSY